MTTTEAHSTLADIAAAVERLTAERDEARRGLDHWRNRAADAEGEAAALRAECASISEEMDLPPGIRPAEGELRRLMGDARVARQERDAALATETATRTALRTQESRISGILADAGLPVGDLVEGVAALVRERDEARRTSQQDLLDAIVAHDETLAALSALAAAQQSSLDRRDEWMRDIRAAGRAEGLRGAAAICDAHSAETDRLAGMPSADGAARAATARALRRAAAAIRAMAMGER